MMRMDVGKEIRFQYWPTCLMMHAGFSHGRVRYIYNEQVSTQQPEASQLADKKSAATFV